MGRLLMRASYVLTFQSFVFCSSMRLVSVLQRVKASAWGELGEHNSFCLPFLWHCRLRKRCQFLK